VTDAAPCTYRHEGRGPDIRCKRKNELHIGKKQTYKVTVLRYCGEG
jgi:hypothetical protein